MTSNDWVMGFAAKAGATSNAGASAPKAEIAAALFHVKHCGERHYTETWTDGR
jgi:hypothetical protein